MTKEAVVAIAAIVIGILISSLWSIISSSTYVEVRPGYIEESVNGDIQKFEYEGVTCLTWKHGYGGGLSCLPNRDLNPHN